MVEVHSCSSTLSFKNTVRKVILELIDLLRFYSYFTNSFKSCKRIVTPKFKSQKFAVEVMVEFKDFQFHYSVQQTSNRVEERLRRTASKVYWKHKSLSKCSRYKDTAYTRYFIGFVQPVQEMKDSVVQSERMR